MPPPYRDPNRLFYDPVNPVMLSSSQMQQLSPQELQAASDQLDQHLVLILQQIEENFSKCNQVVVESLLPAVEQHGENSMRIYESIKFWRPFFEAAASIRLHEPYAAEEEDSNSIAIEQQEGEEAEEAEEENRRQSSVSPDRTVSSVGDETYSSRQSIGSQVEDLEGTPKATLKGRSRYNHDQNDLSTASSSLPPEPHWSTTDNDQFASPFLSSSSKNPPLPANSAMKQQQPSGIPDHHQQLQRLRLRDLPPDSPDVPEPEFETAVFGRGGGGGTTMKGKGRDYNDLSIDSMNGGLGGERGSPSFSHLQNDSSPRGGGTAIIAKGGGDQAHSKLLEKILRKNLDSPHHRRTTTRGPESSTPGKPSTTTTTTTSRSKGVFFPPDLPREWNGIANLSQTNLKSFPSPIKKRNRQSLVSNTTIGGEQEEEGEDSFVKMMAAAAVPPTRQTSSSSTYMTSSPALPNHYQQKITQSPSKPSSSATSTSSLLTRTPVKFAARLTAQNVYESLGLNENDLNMMDSPIVSPPGSLLKTNHKPFNLYQHTIQQQQQQTQREEIMTMRGGSGSEEEEGEGESSPTTDRRSRIIHAPPPPSTTTRGGGEVSYISNSSQNQSYQPSFLGGERDRDISHTQPFDLYQFQQDQQRQNRLQRSVRKGEGEGSEGFEGVDDDDIDDILLGGKTMTFNQERRKESIIDEAGAGPALDFDLGGIVDDDDNREEGTTESSTIGTRRYEEEDELSYVDEEDDRQTGGHDQEEGGYEQHHQYVQEGEEDESFVIERGLRGGAGGGGFGNKLLDGPEDTLFGMPQGGGQQQQQQQSQRTYQELQPTEEDDEDTFTQTQEQEPSSSSSKKRNQGGRDDGRGGGFRLHGLSEMETLHGGELLSSEPFQASPLAGRWNQ
ncbi:hypothetical protein JCM5350_006980 [Sporobolomyces pararoseus]